MRALRSLDRAGALRRARALAVVLAVVLGAAGCAKKGPPSGGPPDLEPPRVVSSEPDSGAAGVARDAVLGITFSEGMEPRSTGDAVALAPRVDIQQRRWSGRTLRLVLAQPLAATQTYTLFVGGNARDRHGNSIAGGATVVFTTADSFPPGVLEGEIEARGFAASGTYLWCYDAATGHLPDSTARDFDAVGLADKDGRFRIAGLRVPARWRIWSFADLNGNRSFEPDVDLLAPADSVYELTRAAPEAKGLLLHVVNPRAPGRVAGRVVVEGAADSTVKRRVWAVADRDSTRAQTFEVRADDTFDIPLPNGGWRLRAFLDQNRDERWQAASEPASDPLRVEVPPADQVKDLTLRLTAPQAKPAEGP